MNRLGSTALICVAFVFSLSSMRHIIEGADVTASTTSNVSLINDSELLKPQELNTNPTKTIVAEQPIHSSIHSHHCHHCRNKTSHKNDSTVPNHDGNSTVPKLPLLKASQKPDDKSNQLQLETTKFITAEKGLPYEEGFLTSNEDTKDNIVIVQSNNSNIIPEEAKLNIIHPKQASESSKIISNHTEFAKEISNQTVDGDGEEVASWIKSPLLQNTFKYLVTDFYPEKILNSLSNRLSFSNKTKVSGAANPSVVYPLVMEGVSVLLNHLTDNSSESTPGVAQGVIRGRIANTMVASIDRLLQNKFPTGEVGSPVEDEKSNLTPASEKANATDGMINLDTLKSLLPLIQTVQNNGELSDVVSKFLINPQSQHGNSDLNSILKNYGSQFNGILNNARVMNAIAKQSSNQSDALNLTSIMEQFMPKNSGAVDGGISPKNPLLRSEFVSTVLSKSPVAHLGALDDNIKKLLTSSLERAVSRVKIDQNGQIRMSEGMKKMVNKMLQDSESKSTGTSALDSINGVLKTVAQMTSGTMNVTEESTKSRRNVTKHSHLHRRFQEKYGKDPRVRNSSPSTSSSSFIFLLLTLPVWRLQVQ